MAAQSERAEGALYAVYAALFVGLVGAHYVDAMFAFTGGAWSAPLDDTFIHFDFARGLARGHFFEWSPGSGFSSGTTSITYPVVLSLGYLAGFRTQNLMAFAVGLAAVSLWIFLLTTARLLRPLGRWAKYLLPPATFSVGFVNWTFASGMETAFFLGLWGLTIAFIDHSFGLPPDEKYPARPGWRAVVLSVLFALLALTRPEALVASAFLILLVPASVPWRKRLATFIGPCVGVGAWSALSWVLTGEAAQAGSVAKLVWFDPFWTTFEKLQEIISNLRFIIVRTTWHHFSTLAPLGLIPPLLAAVPLFFERSRRIALTLWLQIVAWCLLVAQNSHVRFQNERYLAVPTALLLVLAALGVACIVNGRVGESRRRVVARAVGAVAIVGCFWIFQRPNQQFQRWFFGRACRNIASQQVAVGQRLGPREPQRIFVGDAGAITYVADSPGLDGIGLGGYKDYPFAAAYRHGVGATLELVERMPQADRPDYLAVYRSWWGELPEMFGQPLFDVAIEGNVICGDSTKSVYRADWWALGKGDDPQSVGSGHVVETIDFADLMSERARAYAPVGREGRATWSIRRLAPRVREAFDGTRTYGPESGASFELNNPFPTPAQLVLRGDATTAFTVVIWLGDSVVGELEFAESTMWVERTINLPASNDDSLRLQVVATEGGAVLARAWLVTTAP